MPSTGLRRLYDICTTMGANSGVDDAAYEPGVCGSGVDTWTEIMRRIALRRVYKSGLTIASVNQAGQRMTRLFERYLGWNRDGQLALITFLQGRINLPLKLRMTMTILCLCLPSHWDICKRIMMGERGRITANRDVMDSWIENVEALSVTACWDLLHCLEWRCNVLSSLLVGTIVISVYPCLKMNGWPHEHLN